MPRNLSAMIGVQSANGLVFGALEGWAPGEVQFVLASDLGPTAHITEFRMELAGLDQTVLGELRVGPAAPDGTGAFRYRAKVLSVHPDDQDAYAEWAEALAAGRRATGGMHVFDAGGFGSTGMRGTTPEERARAFKQMEERRLARVARARQVLNAGKKAWPDPLDEAGGRAAAEAVWVEDLGLPPPTAPGARLDPPRPPPVRLPDPPRVASPPPLPPPPPPEVRAEPPPEDRAEPPPVEPPPAAPPPPTLEPTGSRPAPPPEMPLAARPPPRVEPERRWGPSPPPPPSVTRERPWDPSPAPEAVEVDPDGEPPEVSVDRRGVRPHVEVRWSHPGRFRADVRAQLQFCALRVPGDPVGDAGTSAQVDLVTPDGRLITCMARVAIVDATGSGLALELGTGVRHQLMRW